MNSSVILGVWTKPKMRKTIAIILSVAALGLNGRAENKVDFAKSVQGIFEARCIDCHGSKKQKGDLRLDSQETALAEVIKPASQAKASSTSISRCLLITRISCRQRETR
ncbi:MAG: hypothetical protein CM1200mP29_15460 [Verrucomicrobiota bacterium]|nr:MAG: hypothetical protein CM1200mP29_15460 [Verrucomicrobiota bacterium]